MTTAIPVSAGAAVAVATPARSTRASAASGARHSAQHAGRQALIGDEATQQRSAGAREHRRHRAREQRDGTPPAALGQRVGLFPHDPRQPCGIGPGLRVRRQAGVDCLGQPGRKVGA
jgi:hypothetical protein